MNAGAEALYSWQTVLIETCSWNAGQSGTKEGQVRTRSQRNPLGTLSRLMHPFGRRFSSAIGGGWESDSLMVLPFVK